MASHTTAISTLVTDLHAAIWAKENGDRRAPDREIWMLEYLLIHMEEPRIQSIIADYVEEFGPVEADA